MKFSAIGLFKHTYDKPNNITKYEERVVITSAASEGVAKTLILAEFADYAQDGIEFLGKFEISEIVGDEVVTEVACTMRVYEGTADEYIENYWSDLRPSSCDEKNWKHSWHNHGGGYSACYNCRELRKGSLW